MIKIIKIVGTCLSMYTEILLLIRHWLEMTLV